MTPQRLVLDACVLINLCATGRLAEIATALGTHFVIPREVSAETFYLRSPEADGEDGTPLDLEALITENVLELADLVGDELVTFVLAADRLDDGEAAALALALHRGLALATDDRAALRLVAAQHQALTVISTAQLMRRYCDQDELSAGSAGRVLTMIEQRARFIPPATDPEAPWWESIRGRVS